MRIKWCSVQLQLWFIACKFFLFGETICRWLLSIFLKRRIIATPFVILKLMLFYCRACLRMKFPMKIMYSCIWRRLNAWFLHTFFSCHLRIKLNFESDEYHEFRMYCCMPLPTYSGVKFNLLSCRNATSLWVFVLRWRNMNKIMHEHGCVTLHRDASFFNSKAIILFFTLRK